MVGEINCGAMICDREWTRVCIDVPDHRQRTVLGVCVQNQVAEEKSAAFAEKAAST
ncbi:MAG: hypothetical protein RR051_07365 [Clostridiales bacterium]